jgi:uncharacterized protein YjbI with pentapeptide repeats
MAAKMDGTDLTGATIRGCNLDHAELNGAHLTKARMSESDLTEVSAKKAQLNECVFTNVHFTKSNFKEANVANATFEGADTKLNGVSFEEADLSDVKFGYDVVLTNPHFDPHSRFNQGYHINFKGATLANVEFQEEGNLAHNNFERADLTGAQLHGRNLQYCNFDKSNLQDADLSGADLRNAKITMDDLRKVGSIEGASFNNLNLEPYSMKTHDKELRMLGVLRLV